MYRVVANYNGQDYEIFNPLDPAAQIYDDEILEEMGKTPSFTFSVPYDHPNLTQLQPLIANVTVYRESEILFSGRVISISSDIYNTLTVECIGNMGYLADSQLAPFSHTGTAAEFFAEVVNRHNALVDKSKQFVVGTITIQGDSGLREVETYTDALSILINYCSSAYGGYIRSREEGGVQYLDWVEDYGINAQVVRFGENILDLSKQINASDVATVLVPEGAEQEDETRLGISSVNNGKSYIENESAVSKWGKIWRYQIFESETTADGLLTAAQNYLTQLAAMPESAKFTALDLSVVDISIPALKLGCWTHFVSITNGISGDYVLYKRRMHITAPENDEVSFGPATQTITGTSLADKEEAKNANDELKNSLKNFQTATSNNFNNLNNGLNGANGNISSLQNSVSSLQTNLSNLTSRVSTAERDITSVESNINNINSDISNLERDLNTTETAANKINWIISGSSSSSFTLTSRMQTLIKNTIDLDDYVTFSDLSTSGGCKINGNNVTSGYVDVTHIGYNNYRFIQCSGSASSPTIDIGESPQMSRAAEVTLHGALIKLGESNEVENDINMYASTYFLQFGDHIDFKASSSGYHIYLEYSGGDYIFRPTNSNIDTFIGTSNYRWRYAYLREINVSETVNLCTSNGSLGFFGHTPRSRQYISNNATIGQLITALKNYGLFS